MFGFIDLHNCKCFRKHRANLYSQFDPESQQLRNVLRKTKIFGKNLRQQQQKTHYFPFVLAEYSIWNVFFEIGS